MKLRQAADAVMVGVNTVLADNPSLTWRREGRGQTSEGGKRLRRIILDSRARTPLDSEVISDAWAGLTTVVVTGLAPGKRVAALSKRVAVWIAPMRAGQIDLRWLLKKLGAQDMSGLLVEGGGEVNASILLQGLAQRIAFFYAPKIIGGRNAIKAVSGAGLTGLDDAIRLQQVEWRRIGPDLFLTARTC